MRCINKTWLPYFIRNSEYLEIKKKILPIRILLHWLHDVMLGMRCIYKKKSLRPDVLVFESCIYFDKDNETSSHVHNWMILFGFKPSWFCLWNTQKLHAN